MEERQAKADFLRTKIPEYRKNKPGFEETDLLIDDILEEYDQRWPLCEFLWPDFDVEKDTPISYAMGIELCKASCTYQVLLAVGNAKDSQERAARDCRTTPKILQSSESTVSMHKRCQSEALVMLLSTLNLSSADRAKLASNLLFDSADKDLTSDTADSQTATAVSSVTGESLAENSIPTFSVAKANSALTAAAKANSTPTVIVDGVDKGAEMDAALATGSVLNVYKGTYFNVPVDPKAGVNLYYITKSRKLGVFSGWNRTGPWVSGVRCALYAKTDSLEEGIAIVKSAIEDGTAVRLPPTTVSCEEVEGIRFGACLSKDHRDLPRSVQAPQHSWLILVLPLILPPNEALNFGTFSIDTIKSLFFPSGYPPVYLQAHFPQLKQLKNFFKGVSDDIRALDLRLDSPQFKQLKNFFKGVSVTLVDVRALDLHLDSPQFKQLKNFFKGVSVTLVDVRALDLRLDSPQLKQLKNFFKGVSVTLVSISRPMFVHWTSALLLALIVEVSTGLWLKHISFSGHFRTLHFSRSGFVKVLIYPLVHRTRVFTHSQRDMLKTFLSGFTLVRSGSLEEQETFWENLFSQWFATWPERVVHFPNIPDDQELSSLQQSLLNHSIQHRQRRIKYFIHMNVLYREMRLEKPTLKDFFRVKKQT
ncbi:uncharacterized protein HD556DRAFT_1314529 [Suillus plorans]|uniref:Uncharacterized protein n=1 Tax=Suillus plorans TaxID=116603 RepID=A0A9P7A9N1_9AGAM|nr:uncharacterized protein HD556DRAFT_1314529 [Suillus plorans]KAG1785080.1 hypothetical protein HD556DRAFT_1314529 [Suillus plorans]